MKIKGIYKKILRQWTSNINSVLEVGAIPSNDTLLALKTFKETKTKIGIHLEKTCKYKDFEIKQQNVNNMKIFLNETFDCVVCASVLEHNKCFWKGLSEMKRVLKSGGLLIINVPGFTKNFLNKIPRFTTTFTYQVHFTDNFNDYYRFSPKAVEEVFLDKMIEKEIFRVAFPPRIIGKGVKK